MTIQELVKILQLPEKQCTKALVEHAKKTQAAAAEFAKKHIEELVNDAERANRA